MRMVVADAALALAFTPHVLSIDEMQKGFQCTPSHYVVIAGVTAGVTAGIEEGIDYRVMDGNVNQQCKSDPSSVSVPVAPVRELQHRPDQG